MARQAKPVRLMIDFGNFDLMKEFFEGLIDTGLVGFDAAVFEADVLDNKKKIERFIVKRDTDRPVQRKML